MRIRALVVSAALVAGSAAAVSASPPPARVGPTYADPAAAGHSALGFHRDDFRSPAALRAARMRILAQHWQASHQVGLAASAQQPVYGFADEDLALPDVDGDGVGDVLSSRLYARTPTLKVLSGRTGRTLWSVSSPGTLGAVYVPIAGGKSVMLLLSDSQT